MNDDDVRAVTSEERRNWAKEALRGARRDGVMQAIAALKKELDEEATEVWPDNDRSDLQQGWKDGMEEAVSLLEMLRDNIK